MQRDLPGLAIAFDGQRQVLIRVHRDGVFKITPLRVGSSIGLDDQIARLQTGLLGGRVWLDGSYHSRLVEIGGHFVVHHRHHRWNRERRQNVHRRASDRDAEPLPLRL